MSLGAVAMSVALRLECSPPVFVGSSGASTSGWATEAAPAPAPLGFCAGRAEGLHEDATTSLPVRGGLFKDHSFEFSNTHSHQSHELKMPPGAVFSALWQGLVSAGKTQPP